jgi:hypothetical protein
MDLDPIRHAHRERSRDPAHFEEQELLWKREIPLLAFSFFRIAVEVSCPPVDYETKYPYLKTLRIEIIGPSARFSG